MAGHPLLVTTGYDLALEQRARRGRRGVRLRSATSRTAGSAELLPRLTRRRVEADRAAEHLRIGAVARGAHGGPHLQGRLDESPERAWESFAVTEDDFIHYSDGRTRCPWRSPRGSGARTCSCSGTRFPTGRCASCSSVSGARSRSVTVLVGARGAEPLEREFWRQRTSRWSTWRRPNTWPSSSASHSRMTDLRPVQGSRAVRRFRARALLFFGRELRARDDRRECPRSRLTVLFGPSGVGKSSLLRAGVAQRLRASGERP